MSDEILKLAQETAHETETSIPPANPRPDGGGQDSAINSEPVDRYGRKFDPAIHVTTKSGAPALYRGRTLIVKTGMQGHHSKRGAARETPTPSGEGSSLGEEGGEGAAPEGNAGAGGAGQPELLHGDAGDLGPTPEERRFKAEIDARNTRRFFRRLGIWLAGPEEGEFKKGDLDDEGIEIQQTAQDWYVEAGVQLPIGAGFMFLFASVSYLARTWNSERHQDRLATWWDILNGKSPAAPPSEDKENKKDGQSGAGKPGTALRTIDERRPNKNIFES